MGNESNQGAQNFCNNLGNAVTSDLVAYWARASSISSLLSNGISGKVLFIGILAGLYIISHYF